VNRVSVHRSEGTLQPDRAGRIRRLLSFASRARPQRSRLARLNETAPARRLALNVGTPPDRGGAHKVPMRAMAFLLATLALALLLVLIAMSARMQPFLWAACVNLAVVTWSAFVLPLRGLPRFDEYFKLRPWERSGRIYHWLGVPLFRALVRHGPLSLSNRALPAAWHSGDPERIEHETRAAEGGHVIAFVIVVAFALAAFAWRDPVRAAWLLALDMPLNFYPVLLQRDHRHRLQEMLRSGELHAGA